MTIAFLSLFFGLITGRYPVEVAVNGPVAAVEILIDGRGAGRIQGPPWKTEVDFGPGLLPHEITARALDAERRVVSEAREWVNLPHSLVKTDILVEGGGDGSAPKAARVVWANLQGQKPRSVRLTFDGLPVPLDGDGRATLPPHDLKSIHVLTADVEFSPLRSVRRDLAYGGEYGSEISTELTGVPVRVRNGRLPPPEKLGGWLTSAGAPLTAVAVEEGPAQLYVVRSPDARETSWTLGSKGLNAGMVLGKLGKEDEVRFLFPFPERFESGGAVTDLFEISPPFETSRYGLPALVRSVDKARRPGRLEEPGGRLVPQRRIADAVAVAAQAAIQENRRRAVLLVLSGHEKDESGYDPATVRRYLAALHVPLFVWSLEKPAPGSTAAAWGEAVDVSAAKNLSGAVRAVREELESQRIIMVDGRHLPQSITLTPSAAGLELVGEGSVP
ncbi:MAG TPA: hypothetical protein VHC97_22415 [Thermoanaerobaculia bacterium]|jgi:hypothetical protein|nr:hypothetical protein [Thermoanaerobaculia bacterium]